MRALRCALAACSAMAAFVGSLTAQAQTTVTSADYEVLVGNFGGGPITDIVYIARDPSRLSGVKELGAATTGPTVLNQTWSSNFLGLDWSPERYNFIAADVNGDGADDLIFQSKTPGDHYVLLGSMRRETSVFESIAQTIPNTAFGIDWSGQAHKLVAGDFDGDGKEDLFFQATDRAGVNAILLASSSGGLFNSASSACWAGGPHLCWSDANGPFRGLKWSARNAVVQAGDFNGDRKADLLVQARPAIAFFDIEIPIPIPIYPPFLNGIALSQSSPGAPQFTVSHAYDRLSLGVDWSPTASTIVVASINSNASGNPPGTTDSFDDLVFQSRQRGRPSYLVRSNGDGSLALAVELPMDAGSAPGGVPASLDYSAEQGVLLPVRFASADPLIPTLLNGLLLLSLNPDVPSRIVSVDGGGTRVTIGLDQVLTFSLFGSGNFLPGSGILPVTSVGTTAGTGAVSDSGEAAYTIPISVPEGINGLTPRLSLRYRHNAGGGLLGRNWDVGGLSKIERCPATRAQDGAPGSILAVRDDQYCLDGNKLRRIAGVQGVTGSQYRTERETYSRITVTGSDAKGPTSFRLEGKDGLIYEYGNSDDSKIRMFTDPTRTTLGSESVIVTWALNAIRDRDGNAIKYNYALEFPNAGIAYPTQILYGGNEQRGIPFHLAITFFGGIVQGQGGIDPIPQTPLASLSNSLLAPEFSPNNLLASIVVSSEGTYQRSYSFNYLSSGNGAPYRALLASVQECAVSIEAGRECLAPTVFRWVNGSMGWSSTVEGGSIPLTSGELNGAVAGDVNGDGFEDAYLTGSDNRIKVLFGGPAGYTGLVDTTFSVTPTFDMKLPIDLDGNGQLDLLIPQGGMWGWLRFDRAANRFVISDTVPVITFTAQIGGGGGSPRPTLPTRDDPSTTTFETRPRPAAVLDVDGDGYPDLLSVGAGTSELVIRFHNRDGSAGFEPTVTRFDFGSSVIQLSAGTPASSLHRTMDIDGDGRDDLLTSAADNRWRVQYSTGAGFASGELLDSFARPIHLNVDACSDLLVGSNPRQLFTSRCRRVNGSALIATPTDLPTGIVGGEPIDWSGRGSEVVLFTQNGALLLGGPIANTPTNVTAPPPVRLISDLDGNGRPDVTYVDANGRVVFQRNTSGQAELMTTVTDGYGNALAFDYKPMTTSGCYTSSGTLPPLDAGLRNFVGGTYLACGTTQPDGVGGQFTVSHRYGDARMNVQGRGFAGFASRTVRDSRTGVYTQEVYRQDFPFTGFLLSSATYQANGTKIAEVSNAPGIKTFSSVPSLSTQLVYVASSVDDEHEVGGSLDGALIMRRTTLVEEVDDFGNPLVLSQRVEDRDATSPQLNATFSLKARNLITNDAARWCLGRASETTVEETRGATTRTQTQTATIDYAMCRSTQEIVDPDRPSLKVVTDYEFDASACGNLTASTVRGFKADGTALPPRTTRVAYGSRCRLPEEITDPLGQKSRVSYRYELGLPSLIEDANGLRVSVMYDNFGRTLLETWPDGTSLGTSYSSCSASNGFCGNPLFRKRVDVVERDTAGAKVRSSFVFYDVFERRRDGSEPLPGGELSRITVDYDAFGRLKSRTVPFVGASNGKEEFDYDLLGRTTRTRLRDAGNGVVRESTVAYAGSKLRVTDARGNLTERTFDALGSLIEVTDPAPGGTTRYAYEFSDQGSLLKTITDALGNRARTRLNVRGFVTEQDDPDLGRRTAVFTSLGELESTTDAKGQTLRFEAYDLLGRPLKRSEPEGTTTFTWGLPADNTSAQKPGGKLRTIDFEPVTGPRYVQRFVYDALGRIQTKSIQADGVTYQFDVGYDAVSGVVDTLTYPVSTAGYRLKLKYGYRNGIRTQISDANAPGMLFWRLNGTDARGQATSEQMGADGFAGRVSIRSRFHPTTGLIESRQSGTQGSVANRQNLAYQWDANGNLSRRTDLNQGSLYESFAYDALDRLKSATRNGATALELSYDPIGNITSKSDVGAYAYPAPGAAVKRPHAVLSAGPNTYAYDDNGNMIRRNGDAITWSSANLPVAIREGERISEFSYTPQGQYWKQVATFAGGARETTLYLDRLFEKVTLADGGVQYRHYIEAGSGTVVHTRRGDGAAETHFITGDHLGSSSSITDSAGALVVNASFDAFGKRRGSDWLGLPTEGDLAAIAKTTRQGFTGHAHLDNLSLIHMNGRVQDPTLGRFISADPFVQDPEFSQSLNRYSYVFNNPLSFTDPSGFAASPDDGPRRRGVNDGSGLSFDFGFATFSISFSLGARPSADGRSVFVPSEPDVSGGPPVQFQPVLELGRRALRAFTESKLEVVIQLTDQGQAQVKQEGGLLVPKSSVDARTPRYVMVYVWDGSFKNLAAGHVMVTTTGPNAKVLLSSFPNAEKLIDKLKAPQKQLSIDETFFEERKQFLRVFTIEIQDTEKFDAEVAHQRSLTYWTPNGSGGDSTQCSTSTVAALNAGGILLGRGIDQGTRGRVLLGNEFAEPTEVQKILFPSKVGDALERAARANPKGPIQQEAVAQPAPRRRTFNRSGSSEGFNR